MDNNTTLSIPHDPSTQQGTLTEHLRARGFAIAGLPEAPRDEPDEPDELHQGELHQGELPTGPTHVAARRSKDQLASARKFIAAAGRVKFDRGRATLRDVWMAVAYYASLGAGPERVCFAQVKTLADKALLSERTIRTHLAALAGHGLIQTNSRGGGHAPTKWSISEFSLHVRGGKNCRAGRQNLPGRAAEFAAEVSNRSLAPTGPELLLASKQPDGACAPPSARKDPPQETKREQPTRTAEPTQALAPVKTDTGGLPRGGATEKQIKFLGLLADRVGAEPAEELWRAADLKRLQKQIKAAIPFKDLKPKHTHTSLDEVMVRIGIENKIGFKEGVQRCECGAARAAAINRTGEADEYCSWTLSGYLVDYLVEWTELHGPKTDQELAEYDDCELKLLTGRWAEPMTFSEVQVLYETLPGERMASGVDDGKDVPADWNRVAAEGLVAAEAKKKARVAAEWAKHEKHSLLMLERKEARFAAEAKEKARVADRLETDWVAAKEKVGSSGTFVPTTWAECAAIQRSNGLPYWNGRRRVSPGDDEW